MFGGENNERGLLDSIERYSVEYDRWTEVQLRLREPVSDSIVFDLGGARILIFGGILDEERPNKKLDIYDLTSECI